MKHRTGHLRKRGENYYVRWIVDGKVFERALRDDQGNPITDRRKAEVERVRFMAPFATASEAAALEAVAAKLEGRRAELERLNDERNPALPLSTAWAEYLKAPNRPDSGDATLRQYGFQWGAFVDWVKATHPAIETLRAVTREIAEQYAAHLNGSGFSPNTFNKHIALLTLVFRILRKKAQVTENPWEEIQRKRLATHSRRELTVDELRKICDAASGELRILLAIGIYCGFRLGDAATLRWCEVDLAMSVIRRVPAKTARTNPDKVVHVPIHPTLRKMISEIPADQRGDYVLPEIAALYRKRIDLVTDMVQRHLASCGIKTHKPGTGEGGKRAIIQCGYHSLRHSFVSLCRVSGAPLSVVESIVGHSNPSMTRHYTHVGELAAGQAVAALPAIMGDPEREPAKRDPEALLARALALVENMDDLNWTAKRTELLTVLQTP